MARNPRPIDPSQGPLQAFAVELRRLRESAGSPTYRAMAVRAGFSATTLSEAAGGVRKPSLDVTLAFVGVCGGDAAEWRERWAQLERALATEAAVEQTDPSDASDSAASGDEPDQASDAGGEAAAVEAADGADGDVHVVTVEPERPGDEIPGAGRARVGRRAAILATAAALIAAAVILPQRFHSGSAVPAATQRLSPPSASGCPAMPAGHAAFTGEIYIQGTHEHSGARLDAPVIASLPAPCTIAFSGYCIGQSLRDQRSGTPDMRWFKLLDGSGVVASAVVHGNPPPDLSPTSCPDDAPPPAVVHLHLTAVAGSPTAAVLSATGIDAPTVGFAAYYSAQTGVQAPNWHELALYDADYMPAPQWNMSGARAAISGLPGVPNGTVPVVAVACLGGGAPTQIVDAAAVQPGQPVHTDAVQLSAQLLSAAEQVACEYPATG
jgi:hypothetical protein